jgi:carboxypeptidase PM20D1
MSARLKKIAVGLGAGVALVLAIMVIRAVGVSSYQVDVDPIATIDFDQAGATERLAAALRIPTISSRQLELFDKAPFEQYLNGLEAQFPAVYGALTAERIAGHSLLLHWPGRDPAAAPILFMAHLDMVPVEPGTEADWTYAPFAGTVADGFFWGRGALDIKSGVLALHEAVQILLQQGYQPQRSIWLAFGHDEEIGGGSGNQSVAAVLEQRGQHFAAVIDEGGFVLDGLIPEISPRPTALIDIAEKAYCTIQLTIRGEGGHSSMPPPHTTVGRISSAIQRLEANPFPTELCDPVRLQLQHLAPEMPFLPRLVLSNLWLTAPLVKAQLAANERANALVRTTTAATMISGGVQENVVPQQAGATVNFRLLPGTTPEQVLKHVRRVIDDPAIELTLGMTTYPPASSSVDSPYYRAIARSVREIYPDCVVLPTLLFGATDSRHYAKLADQVYRFHGLRLPLDDVAGFHGTNERVGVQSYLECIRIMVRMMQNLDAAD